MVTQTTTRDRPTPDEFADKLQQHGMPKKQAEVYAYREAFNYTNGETASQLQKDKSTVTQQHETAIEHVSNAYAINHLARNPEYITELPTQIGELTYSETDSPVHIRLHRPRLTRKDTAHKYTLTYSEVIEIFKLSTTTQTTEYLLVYNHYDDYKNKGERTYYTLEKQFIARFILDWVLPNRYSGIRRGNDEKYADKWFVTDLFDCNNIKNQLQTHDVEPLSVLTDDRFVTPDPETVQLQSGAKTGNTGFGYRPAYTPTKTEIETALKNNTIDEELINELNKNKL
jgi:hypothetical protein